MSAECHRCREVHGERRLADATLARCNGIDARERSGLGERDLCFGAVALQELAHRLALLVGHDAHLNNHRVVWGDRADRGGDITVEGVFQRAAGHRKQELDGDGVRRDDDAVNHA